MPGRQVFRTGLFRRTRAARPASFTRSAKAGPTSTGPVTTNCAPTLTAMSVSSSGVNPDRSSATITSGRTVVTTFDAFSHDA